MLHDAAAPPDPHTNPHSMHLTLLLLVSALSSFQGVKAAPVNPEAFPSYPQDGIQHHNSRRNPVLPLHIGKLTVHPEKTTLDEVKQQLGTGVIRHSGDASESVTFLCYTVITPKSAQRLWLGSSEMGGGSYINLISARQLPAKTSPSESCPPLPAQVQHIHFSNGVWLGSSRHQTARWGATRGQTITAWQYYHPAASGDGALYSSLMLRFARDRVVEIMASQVTSD